MREKSTKKKKKKNNCYTITFDLILSELKMSCNLLKFQTINNIIKQRGSNLIQHNKRGEKKKKLYKVKRKK